MVVAVHSILSLLKPVQPFEANAQALAQLPDQVCAGVMAGVVELAKGVVSSGSELGRQAVQIYVSVGDGGAELRAPSVGEPCSGAPLF